MYKVYQITNCINNKTYIGYTQLDIEHRWRLHVNSGSSKMLISRAIKKYGPDNFIVELLANFDTKQEAVAKEIELIDRYNPPYNIHSGGTGGPMLGEMNGRYGKEHTQQWKDNMSRIMSGENNPMYGRKHTEESKKKISAAAKGRTSHFKGKKHKPESLAKMRVPKTEEFKQKIRNTYLVDGVEVNNIKQWCLDNGHNYVAATQAAKNGKQYKGHTISKLGKFVS